MDITWICQKCGHCEYSLVREICPDCNWKRPKKVLPMTPSNIGKGVKK